MSTMQISSIQPGSAQAGAAQIGAIKLDTAQTGAAQSGSAQADAAQIGAMPMPVTFKYKDVFSKGYPRHEGWDYFRRKHPPMPAEKWAKIFAPFDALRGFDSAILSKEVRYVDRVQQDDQQRAELSRRLAILRSYTLTAGAARKNRIRVTAEAFVPCTDPDHAAYALHRGQYKCCTGVVIHVDTVQETLRLRTEDGEISLAFEDILSIRPQQEGLFDEDCSTA